MNAKGGGAACCAALGPIAEAGCAALPDSPEIRQRIDWSFPLSVRRPAAKHLPPEPKKGTQGRIGPVEAIRKTDDPEVLAAISRIRQNVPPGSVGQNQPVVAIKANPIPKQSQGTARRRIFGHLESVKGTAD